MSVTWGYETRTLKLGHSEWAAICAGESLSIAGPGYRYEGQRFEDTWSFVGGLDGGLLVTYREPGLAHSDGVGFDGALASAAIIGAGAD